MAALSVHIVVLCIGLFVAIEGFSIPDGSLVNERLSDSINNKWLKKIEENLKLHKQEKRPRTNNIIAILLAKKRNDDVHERKQRHGRTMNAFLQKLNSFIHKYSKNNIYGKRDGCSSGFENHFGKCRREKRLSLFGRPKSVVVTFPNTDNYRRNQRQYRQHMVVERARHHYSSSETDNFESSSDEHTRKGKRFKIVDNGRTKRPKVSSESETDSGDNTDSDYTNDDENDAEYSDQVKHSKKKEFVDQESLESDKESSRSDKESAESDNSNESDEPFDSKYMYLQGARLHRPRARTRRDDTRTRLPHFLPKRYHWDQDAIHELDSFWLHGLIKPKKYL